MTAWAHLPNAAHIDAVLADARARPEIWAAAGGEVLATERAVEVPKAMAAARAVALTTAGVAELVAARDAVWALAWDAARTLALDAALDAELDAVWATAGAAMYALIAWDESAALLDLAPDALRTIISTYHGAVKHQAVLLLPAVIARSTV